MHNFDIDDASTYPDPDKQVSTTVPSVTTAKATEKHEPTNQGCASVNQHAKDKVLDAISVEVNAVLTGEEIPFQHLDNAQRYLLYSVKLWIEAISKNEEHMQHLIKKWLYGFKRVWQKLLRSGAQRTTKILISAALYRTYQIMRKQHAQY